MKKCLKYEEASVVLTCCLFSIMMVTVIILASFKLNELKITKNYIEDGLTLSGLAGALYDVDKVSDESIVIDKELSYNAFLDALKVNLNLNDDMISQDQELISSVEVKKYIVYDYMPDKVIITTYNEDGTYTSEDISNEVVTAPDGTDIKKSSIYIELGVYAKGIFNSDGLYTIFHKIVGLRET